MAKKDIQQMLRASVEAEDLAVKDRFSKVDALFEKNEDAVKKKRSRTTADRTAPLSGEDIRVIARVRERLIKQGIVLSKPELALAGFYALLHASDEEILKTVEHLQKGKRGRPVFPSARGRFRLSRLD